MPANINKTQLVTQDDIAPVPSSRSSHDVSVFDTKSTRGMMANKPQSDRPRIAESQLIACRGPFKEIGGQNLAAQL